MEEKRLLQDLLRWLLV